jgi:hypothetical protein
MKTTANTATYTAEWADKLYRGCKRNLTEEFRFVCITDHEQEEFKEPIEAVPFLHQEHVGTWMCINEIFRPDLEIEHGLFMGLDTVICKNIDALANYQGRFCMVKHPRFDNRLMNAITLFRGFDCAWMWERYIKDPQKAVEESKTRHWASKQGSEMLWWEKLNPYCDTVDRVAPGFEIHSYKMEKNRLPDSHVIYWHGKLKPHNCKEDEVTKNWI